MIFEKPTLLLVDDEPSNVDFLVNILGSKYNLKVAYSGEQALEILDEIAIDLILLDISMPSMDGFAVAKILQDDSKLKAIPFIFLTSSSEEDSIIKGFQIGAVDYVTKPFHVDELLVRVNNHLKIARLQKELKLHNESLQEQIELTVSSKLKILQQNKQQEALLVQQSKMAEMGELLGAILHQWAQPLNMIAAVANNLEFFKDEDDLVDMQEKILDKVHFMGKTMQNFREFFQTDKPTAVFQPIDIVHKVYNMFEELFSKNNISFHFEQEEELNYVEGNENELMQVILNILNNAKDALLANEATQKNIWVKSYATTTHAVLVFGDNAGGIPQDLLPDRLFEPRVSTKGDRGTGIGLSICKTIIKDHFGGDIFVQNDSKGAVFTLEIPLAQTTKEK